MPKAHVTMTPRKRNKSKRHPRTPETPRSASPRSREPDGLDVDSAPPGWPADDEPDTAMEPRPADLWDWEEGEPDYAQDIELEQYALRVLRGERDD